MRPYIHPFGSVGFFQWNLDCSVGRGGNNTRAADVSYIQWYYTLAAENPLTPDDRKAIYQKVQVTGFCSGMDNDPLVQAIIAHQRALDHPVIDGKISVARGDGKLGAKAFFILRLGARLANMYPTLWPRLDLMPRCPPSVAEVSRAAIPSTLPHAT